jgi:MoxR-like ATPase
VQQIVRRVPVSDHVVAYAVSMARNTRPAHTQHQFIKDYVSWGAGPRASQYLILASKTRAVLHGRPTPSVEDVRAVAPSVLRHRVIANFNAEAENIQVIDLITRLMKELPEPKEKVAATV